MDKIPNRSEIDSKYKWKLETIFSSDQSFENELNIVDKKVKNFIPINHISETTIEEHVENVISLYRDIMKLYIYSHCKNDQDISVPIYSTYYNKVKLLYSKFGEVISFFEPMLLSVDKDELQKILNSKKLKKYRYHLDDLIRYKSHTLSKKEEFIIASTSNLLSGPTDIFGNLNNLNLTFDSIKKDGKELPLSISKYRGYLISEDQDIREQAFKKLSKSYKNMEHTFSSILYNHIQGDIFLSKIKNYNSSIENSLFNDNVPIIVYENLIKSVDFGLKSLFRYYKFQKERKNIAEIHLYDLYSPIISFKRRYSFEEAVEIVLNSLKPLGKQYVQDLKNGIDSGWIDVFENKGKKSGAYCTGSYDTGPFVLLNFDGTLESVFTLAHELGHAMHSFYSAKKQDPLYAEYKIFVAEVASITNEFLLRDYMINNADNDDEKLYLKTKQLDAFKGTYFRQTMFAEFEKIVHKKVENGIPFTPEMLNEIYYNLNKKYFGDDVIIDKEIEIEWARIPHFYFNFYVYKYAIGFAASAAISKRLLDNEKGMKELYVDKFLSAGGSKYPIDILKDSGVDFTTDKPFKDAMELFNRGVDSL